MKVIAIIPARGGSKGIPRKNMRLMHGKPLVAYAVETALECPLIDDVVVSSDSNEILSFVRQYEGVIPIERDSDLARDAVTLDPVIYDAVLQAEARMETNYDAVITMQPTSPLLTSATLQSAIENFAASSGDTLISVVNKPHLNWKKSEYGEITPAYERRLNRQQLPANYLETGAFLISNRINVTENGRLGKGIDVFEVPEVEAVDIDTAQDWIVCEALLSRKTIAFRVDGYRELGLGHVFRAMTLSYEFIEHDIVFVCDQRHREGINKLKSAFLPVEEVDGDEGFFEWLRVNTPDILVNDLLDTTNEYVESVKPYVGRFVSFEDLGAGARSADAVVNALYEGASQHSNVFSGKSFVCLRDEFLTSKPLAFSPVVRRILVTFGGTDPLNITARIYAIAKKINEKEIQYEFEFVLGPGYADTSIIPLPCMGISVHRDVNRMSDLMGSVDLAFSSQGRTTYELACIGVPTIVLAQNEREQLHSFAQMDNGFINLGLASNVNDDDIETTLEWLAGAPSVRKEMRRLMLKNDLRSGIKRVKRIILGETI